MSALFERLKSGTEQHHRELEKIVDPLANFHATEAYRAYLVKALAFYESLETQLGAFDWAALGIDFGRRQKAALIVRDLNNLGIGWNQTNATGQPLNLPNVDFALGCLYVVEGATLGGQIISRHLATLGIGPENGGLFFHGYGPQTGQMWKSFRAAAIGYCVTEDQISTAVSGARAAFRNFQGAMQPASL